MPQRRAIVDRFYEAFNARDFETWCGLLGEDVEITVDSGVLCGRDAARAYAAGIVRAYPGVVSASRRVVAEGADTVVSEFRLINPASTARSAEDERAEPWRLEGLICEVIRLRDEHIVELRSYYAPTDRDRTDVAQVPSRAEAAHIAEEQSALRRVATLVAEGVSQQRLFTAVNEEVAHLVDADATSLMRFEPDDTMTLLAAWSTAEISSAIGERRGLDAELRAVRESVRPTRFGPAELPATGPFVEEARRLGLRSSVGVPIVVDGRVWGISFVASVRSEPFAPDTESRIAAFTELVATALANAQARADLHRLADEQSALRRVAELAVEGAPAAATLEPVVVQASELAGVDFTMLVRFEPDGATEIVALDGAPEGLEVGMRAPADGDGAVQRVWRTGRPARIDDLGAVSGHWPQVARELGFSATAAVPVRIEGALWGALVVGRHEPLPRETEEHMMHFAELAGTAISAAHARSELRVLADEQTALRRVAELVARGAALDEVFDAVAREASHLLGDDIAAALLRYDVDGVATVVAACSSPAPLGLRVPAQGDTNTGEVLRTGRPARVNSFEGTQLAAIAHQLGVSAAVAVPVMVEGRVWGTLSTSSPGSPPPPGTEARLTQFADLAGAAIANAENKAKLTASRARVVATADATRRRLQRDVHDGAQQRLVHSVITLKLAQDAVAQGGSAAELIDEALQHAERANIELRDLVRGIMPAALTRGGLREGLESLVGDIAVPVDLEVSAPRLPTQTETTAYFIVAEALTNVVKHARADRASVAVAVEGDSLSIDIRDDGAGGADPATGTGLTGLLDRVEASDGTLTVSSPPGQGTTLHATLPVAERAPAT